MHACQVEFWTFLKTKKQKNNQPTKLNLPFSSLLPLLSPNPRRLFTIVENSQMHPQNSQGIPLNMDTKWSNEENLLKYTQIPVPLSTLEHDLGRIYESWRITDSHALIYTFLWREWGEKGCSLPATPSLTESSGLVPFPESAKGSLKKKVNGLPLYPLHLGLLPSNNLRNI